MLLITREADYALRIMRALAGGEQRTAADICQQEQIPDQFVYKIAKKLEKAGFFKGFIRMFFRFWIMRYGIVGAIPHFLSKE